MFRLSSLDPDTNILTNWTVGDEEDTQLGGIQTRSDLSEQPANNTLDYLFKQDGKRLYNATKTRALRVCPETRKCRWTRDLTKASDFQFVRQNLASEDVWLVASQERLVLGKNGKFAPYSDPSIPISFTREMQPEMHSSSSSSSSASLINAAAVNVTTTSQEDDRWGNWIYVLLIFFLVLLIYFIYLLDLATCVFSSKYKPVISPEVADCSLADI